MDKTDIKLLRQIEIDGRQSFAKLGERVGLSKTPCWQRVQKLETDLHRPCKTTDDVGAERIGLLQHVTLAAKAGRTHPIVGGHWSSPSVPVFRPESTPACRPR